MKNIFAILIFIFCFYNSSAQKKFSVKIKFPSNVNNKYLTLHYDNGKDRYVAIKPNFVNNEITVSGVYFSKYATIFIDYADGKYGFNSAFWLINKPSSIQFLNKKDGTNNPINNFKLINAYSHSTMGEEKLAAYCFKEDKDFIDFITKNQMNDSLVLIAFEKAKVRNKKVIEFVENHGSLYYSFWLFRNRVMFDPDASPDSLLKIYTTVFPVSLKNSYEGKVIVKYLKGRKLSRNDDYIDFSVKDINGRIISLSKCQSKFVLLTFWDSWCGPCIKEMPMIKKMRNLYSQDKLEIISVNWDNKLKDFQKAVKTYEMNWIHIQDQNETKKINESYGIGGVGEVFLIDIINKKIIYRNLGESDSDLSILEGILAEKL